MLHAESNYVTALAYGGDDTPLTWVYGGNVYVGSVTELADHLAGCDNAGEARPQVVYAPSIEDTLVGVAYSVTSTGYGEDDYSTSTVAVDLGDGVTVSASWSVDGRA
jgi:hypothetical protein